MSKHTEHTEKDYKILTCNSRVKKNVQIKNNVINKSKFGLKPEKCCALNKKEIDTEVIRATSGCCAGILGWSDFGKQISGKGVQCPRDKFAKAADQAEERVCLICPRIARSDQENLINFKSPNFFSQSIF